MLAFLPASSLGGLFAYLLACLSACLIDWLLDCFLHSSFAFLSALLLSVCSLLRFCSCTPIYLPQCLLTCLFLSFFACLLYLTYLLTFCFTPSLPVCLLYNEPAYMSRAFSSLPEYVLACPITRLPYIGATLSACLIYSLLAYLASRFLCLLTLFDCFQACLLPCFVFIPAPSFLARFLARFLSCMGA